SPVTLTKAPLVKLGQRRKPVLASPRTIIRRVLTLSFDFQSSRKIKAAASKMTKPIRGQFLSIRSRIATVTHAATTSVVQTEFAASQKRQEVTKLDEKEGDEPLKIRLCPASAPKLLMYRLTLVATLIVVLMLGSYALRFR